MNVTPRQTMRDIAKAVADRHGVSIEDLFSETRRRPVAWARQEAMAEIRETGRFSTTQIGRLFNRDHTTVIFALRRVAKRRAA